MVPLRLRVGAPVLVGLLATGVLVGGCAPLEQPVEIAPGGLFLAGAGDRGLPNRWCTLAGDDADSLDCTDLGRPEGAPRWAHAWDRDGTGEPVIVGEVVGRGFSACARDEDDCGVVDFDDAHEWARPFGAVASGDLDGDGREDLVFAGITDADADRPPPRLCRSAGPDRAPDCEDLPADTDRNTDPTVADLDQDGNLDVIVGAFDNEHWATDPQVCLGDGAGGLVCTPWSPIQPDAHSPLAWRTRVGDLNGDGIPDVLVLQKPEYNPAPVWCEGAPGVPPDRWCIDTPSHTVPVPEFYYDGEWMPMAPKGARLVDLDGDGDLDLLADRAQPFVCENPGDGALVCAEQAQVRLGDSAGGLDTLGVADLDGDGQLEIFLVVGELVDGAVEETLHLCRFRDGALSCGALPEEAPAALEAFGAAVVP